MKEDVQNLWSFVYHNGPAYKTANVRARNEETAWRVARAWCVSRGFRPPANVQPFIVADESILSLPLGEYLAELPDPVAATTGTPDLSKAK